MKILFLGDVVGCVGWVVLIEYFLWLCKDWCLDFVVVNGENVSNGMGFFV